MTTGLMGSAGMTGTERLRVDADRLWGRSTARDFDQSLIWITERYTGWRVLHDVHGVSPVGRAMADITEPQQEVSRGVMRRGTSHDGGADHRLAPASEGGPAGSDAAP
jgi:hypothetical protein